jgi:ribosome-associated protein
MATAEQGSAKAPEGVKSAFEPAREAARAALEKKALDLVVLDMTKLVYYTDYFVICTGTSSQHVEAVVESVEKSFAGRGVRPAGVEGRSAAHWVLMDYGDVVVHVFDPEAREYYELEKLWMDASRIRIDEDKAFVDRQDQGVLDSRGD